MRECVEISLARTSAVYQLLWHGEVVYVGQSKDVLGRITQHRRMLVRWLKGKPVKAYGYKVKVVRFDSARIFFCDVKELNALEKEMIWQFKPRFNTFGKHTYAQRKEIDIEALAEMAGLESSEWRKPATNVYSPVLSRNYRRIA